MDPPTDRGLVRASVRCAVFRPQLAVAKQDASGVDFEAQISMKVKNSL